MLLINSPHTQNIIALSHFSIRIPKIYKLMLIFIKLFIYLFKTTKQKQKINNNIKIKNLKRN